MIFLYIIFGYIFFVFVLLRLIVPNLGFKQKPIPNDIPKELSDVIDKLNSEAQNNENYLALAHKYVINKYSGSHFKTMFTFWKAFKDPLQAKPGFMHCMGQNHILRVLLIKSGRFKEADVKVTTKFLDLFIHQYLKVKVNGKATNVDPWGDFVGTPLGESAKWFKFSKH